MAEDRYLQKTLPGGLTLLAEKMSGVQSAAMMLLLPAGSATDPEDQQGVSTVLSDLVLRGAGNRDSRQLVDHLDGLGLQRSSSVGIYHAHFSCAAVADKVIEGLGVYADIVRRPTMPESGFEAARDLALQALAGIEDEPRQKLLIALRERHFPAPFGRNPIGRAEDLEALELDQCKADFAHRYHAKGGILALAGNLDFDVVTKQVEKYFGDFGGASPLPPEYVKVTERFAFQEHASEQTHIGVAYETINETDEDYYAMCLAKETLGGGMSGRLYTELREKRGLVYNVSAGYNGLKGLGAVFCYAGTSNERAQMTLDCILATLRSLGHGITSEELERSRIGLKASVIMQGESTSSRAAGIAHDYFLRGRIRTLDEMKAKINEVTLDRVNAFLKRCSPDDFTVVIVGPKALKVK